VYPSFSSFLYRREESVEKILKNQLLRFGSYGSMERSQEFPFEDDGFRRTISGTDKT
jgi:hypothetical protein